MSDTLTPSEYWQELSPTARDHAETLYSLTEFYRAQGKDYFSSFVEDELPWIIDNLTDVTTVPKLDKDGNPVLDSLGKPVMQQRNTISDYSFYTTARMITGWYMAAEEGGENADEWKRNAQGVYDKFDGRLDTHMKLFSPHVLGELQAGMGGRPEPSTWRKVVGGVLNVVDHLDIGWEKVGSVVVGNTAGLVHRGLKGDGWEFKSSGELDVDNDGRASFMEAIAGRSASGWQETVIDIAGEIAFDPLTYLSFGASAGAKASMKMMNRSLTMGGASQKEIAKFSNRLAVKGTQGLSKAERTNTVDLLLQNHLRDRQSLWRKVNTKTTADAPNDWTNLSAMFTKNPFGQSETTRRGFIDSLPKHWQEPVAKTLKQADRNLNGLEGFDVSWVDDSLLRLGRNLRSLDRSAKAGPKLAGRTIKWWDSTWTLGGNKVTSQYFNHQTTRLLGGNASRAFQFWDNKWKGIRPRSGIVGKDNTGYSYSHGVVDGVRTSAQRARSDIAMKTKYARSDLSGFVSQRKRKFAENFQYYKIGRFMEDGSSQPEPGARWFFPDYDDRAMMFELEKAGKQGAFTKIDPLYNWEALLAYKKARRPLAKSSATDNILARKEYKRLLESYEETNNTRALDYIDELQENFDVIWSKQIEGFRTRFAMAHKPKHARAEAYIPFDEAKERLALGSGGGPGGLSNLVTETGGTHWLTTPELLHEIDNSMLVSNRLPLSREGFSHKAIQRGALAAKGLWDSNALALVRGLTYLTTNVLGGVGNAIITGTPPHLLAKNAYKSSRLINLHRQASNKLKAINSLRREIPRLTKKSVYVDETKEQFKSKDELLADLKMAGSKKKDIPERTRKEIQAVTARLKKLSEQEFQNNSYILHLKSLGADRAETGDLLYLGSENLIGSSRAGDLFRGQHEILTDPNITANNKRKWIREVDSPYEGERLKAYVDKLSKGDFETIKQTLNLGSHFPSMFVEDFLRVNTFMAARDMGMDVSEAAGQVFRSQFDYDDLTRGEANFKARLSSFYTYPRKLLGMMSDEILQHPGRVMATTRAMYDSIKFAHEVGYNDEFTEGYIDFMIPNWLENVPGHFKVDGIAGRIRLSLPEYVETISSLISIPLALFPQDDTMNLFYKTDFFDARESAKNALNIFAGFWPNLGKHVAESAANVNLFTGAELDPVNRAENSRRLLSIFQPGTSQAWKNVESVHSAWAEGEEGRLQATTRMVGYIVGSWQMHASEADEQAIAEMIAEGEQAMDQARDEGIKFSTIGELEKAGALYPTSKARRFIYGVQLDRDHPDYDPDKPISKQYRLLTEQEIIDLAPKDLVEIMGLEQSEQTTGPLIDSRGMEAWISRTMLDAAVQEVSGKDWAEFVTQNAVNSRRDRELTGIAAPPTAKSRFERKTDEEQLAEIRREFALYNINLDEAQLIEELKYVNETVYQYRQAIVDGSTPEEAMLKVYESLPEYLRSLTEPGWFPEQELPKLGLNAEELELFNKRVMETTGTLTFFFGFDTALAELLARVSLMSRYEQTQLFGAPLIPSNRLTLGDFGLPGNTSAVLSSQQKLRGY